MTFRSSTTYSSDGVAGTTVTLAKPAGVVAGDFLIAHIETRGGGAVTPPAGWSLLRSTGRLSTYLKTASVSEPASYTFAVSVSQFHGGVLCAYEDVHEVSTSAGVSGTSSSSTFAAPSVAATAAGEILHCAWTIDHGVADSLGMTPPTGMSERADAASYAATLMAADETITAAGATGTRTASTTGTINSPADAHTLLLVTNAPPSAPSLTSPADGATIDLGITQRFSLTASDPDVGDTTSKTYWRYRIVATATWTEVTRASPSTFYDFPPGTFTAGNYEWQAATEDAQALKGPYSASSFFTATTPTDVPTITSPVGGGTVAADPTTVEWSTAGGQDAYQVRRVADNAGAPDTATVYYDTGQVNSTTARSASVPFETNDRYEHIQVRVQLDGLWSQWASIRVLVSYTPPPTPTVTPSADDAAGAVVVTYSTPTPGTGEPTPEYTDIEVRDTTGRDRHRPADGVRVATLQTPSGTFIDWLPAAGINYEYRVTAVGDNGTTAASAWTPIDANATASVYYGGGY